MIAMGLPTTTNSSDNDHHNHKLTVYGPVILDRLQAWPDLQAARTERMPNAARRRNRAAGASIS